MASKECRNGDHQVCTGRRCNCVCHHQPEPTAVEHSAEWHAEMARLESTGLTHVQAWDKMRAKAREV